MREVCRSTQPPVAASMSGGVGRELSMLPHRLGAPQQSRAIYHPHTRFGGLHFKVDIDKKPDALARHNGRVDGVKDLIPQAVFRDFRVIIRVVLEVSQSGSCHQERSSISATIRRGSQPKAGVSTLHLPSAPPDGKRPPTSQGGRFGLGRQDGWSCLALLRVWQLAHRAEAPAG